MNSAMLLGAHVNRNAAAPSAQRATIVRHIEAAIADAKHETGVALGAVQIFVSSPRRQAITLAPDERSELRAYLARTGLRAFAHSTYVASPWRGDPGSIAFIREELAVCAEAGVSGLVVHLPRAPPATVVEFLPRLLPAPPGVRIFLETPAVAPSEAHYNTPEKLDALFAAIRATVAPRLEGVGLCVDSAHLWTSGIDLRSYGAADRWLQGLEAIEPADLEVMFHLNDSACERGHGPDKHEALGHGKIWGSFRDYMAASGVAALAAYARRTARAVILERAPRELLAGDFRLLRRLALA